MSQPPFVGPAAERDARDVDPFVLMLLLEPAKPETWAKLMHQGIESLNWACVDLSRQRGPLLRQLEVGD